MNLKKITAALNAINPGNRLLNKEVCSDLGIVLKDLAAEKFGLVTFLQTKIAILKWQIAISENPNAKQKRLRNSINENPLILPSLKSLVKEFQGYSKNPKLMIKGSGLKTEGKFVIFALKLNPGMVKLYKAGSLTVEQLLTVQPEIFLIP